MGGVVAEPIIFGEENITIGSNQDLINATKLATQILYSCGMGDTLAAFGNEHMDETPTSILDNNTSQINRQAKDLLDKAEILAQETLEKQKVLLLHLSDYLSDKRAANKEKIKGFVAKYAVDFAVEDIIEDADHLFYREHLKKQIREL